MNTSDEISLHQVLQVFTKRWKYFIVLALVFILGALSKHKYFPTYPGTGKLIIKDVSNSQLQLIIGQVAGVGYENTSKDYKGEDSVSRAIALLDIHEFFVSVARSLIILNVEQNNPTLNHFFSGFVSDPESPEFVHEVASRLSNLISFNASKSEILEVNAKTNYRELTLFLVNVTLSEAQKNLIDRELDELNKAETYFNLEIDRVRQRLNRIENSTVLKMQKKQIFSLDSEKGESEKYIGELIKNINDTRIALTNNESKIYELKKNINASGVKETGLISKFNESSQIRFLEDENNELNLELKTYKSYLKSFKGEKTGLVPFQYELDKMNAGHDFEYKMYASLNDSLARIGLQKTYVKNKIEILEPERISKVYSSPPLLMMVLIALTVSQVFGVFSIYLYELFRPNHH